MATLAEPETDFARLPELPADVFTAPLMRPAHVGEDWLEPSQTEYSAEDDAIWNDLFARQMEVLPGRAATAFMSGLDKLNLDRGGVPEFGKLSEDLDALTGWSVVPVPISEAVPVARSFIQTPPSLTKRTRVASASRMLLRPARPA